MNNDGHYLKYIYNSIQFLVDRMTQEQRKGNSKKSTMIHFKNAHFIQAIINIPTSKRKLSNVSSSNILHHLVSDLTALRQTLCYPG